MWHCCMQDTNHKSVLNISQPDLGGLSAMKRFIIIFPFIFNKIICMAKLALHSYLPIQLAISINIKNMDEYKWIRWQIINQAKTPTLLIVSHSK